MPVLDVDDVTVRFGGLTALDNVSLAAAGGRVTGLIGPNGAGKSTLFDVVTGLRPAAGGRVRLGGRDLRGMGPGRRARLGLARTFQRLELFGLLSVRENVLVAAEARRRWTRDGSDPGDVADACLARLGLRELAGEPADNLPTGLARLVEVARALASRPRVLLLDEPASGLSAAETGALTPLLRSLAADGLAVVLVEHDVGLVAEVCDVVHVLDAGRVLASGPPAEVRADPRVIAAYLGPAAGVR
ncbi:MAG: ABC transporter ATP-binding protein [Acidimicrobiales bacterium]|nr:ABC transporter ATP-binding protein [Acidimicrobiales bacterium]